MIDYNTCGLRKIGICILRWMSPQMPPVSGMYHNQKIGVWINRMFIYKMTLVYIIAIKMMLVTYNQLTHWFCIHTFVPYSFKQCSQPRKGAHINIPLVWEQICQLANYLLSDHWFNTHTHIYIFTLWEYQKLP